MSRCPSKQVEGFSYSFSSGPKMRMRIYRDESYRWFFDVGKNDAPLYYDVTYGPYESLHAVCVAANDFTSDVANDVKKGCA